MKFAAPYKNKCFIQPDEYNINFSEYSKIETLIDFISDHKDTIINISFTDAEDIEKVYPVFKVSDNVRIRIRYDSGISYIDKLNELDIPFILDSSIPVGTYGMFDWAISIGAKGIYITDDLFYNLARVKTQCDKANIEIRMILNRIPCSTYWASLSKCAPIFRPQDFPVLDDYINVGEFNCYDSNNHYDWIKCKTQYKIWFEDHYWDEDLKFINDTIPFPIMTPCVPPELATYRINCNYACKSHDLSYCNKCARLYKIADINREAGIGYKPGTTQGIPSNEELLEMLKQKESKND